MILTRKLSREIWIIWNQLGWSKNEKLRKRIVTFEIEWPRNFDYPTKWGVESQAVFELAGNQLSGTKAAHESNMPSSDLHHEPTLVMRKYPDIFYEIFSITMHEDRHWSFHAAFVKAFSGFDRWLTEISCEFCQFRRVNIFIHNLCLERGLKICRIG